jgi:hypothetical protein
MRTGFAGSDGYGRTSENTAGTDVPHKPSGPHSISAVDETSPRRTASSTAHHIASRSTSPRRAASASGVAGPSRRARAMSSRVGVNTSNGTSATTGDSSATGAMSGATVSGLLLVIATDYWSCDDARGGLDGRCQALGGSVSVVGGGSVSVVGGGSVSVVGFGPFGDAIQRVRGTNGHGGGRFVRERTHSPSVSTLEVFPHRFVLSNTLTPAVPDGEQPAPRRRCPVPLSSTTASDRALHPNPRPENPH